MDIQLQKDSFVNERTGEVAAPSEYWENLRDIERQIAHLDDEIDEAKAALKALRDTREKAVSQLRAAVREGKVLPLLEMSATLEAPAGDEGADGDDEA